MIEIVFGDSALGGLKMAQHYGEGKYQGGCTAVIFSKKDGSVPTQEELDSAQNAAEEQIRLEWEQATPMGGNPQDVFGFNLILSIGDISKDGFANGRQKAIDALWSIYPDAPSDGSNDVTAKLEKNSKSFMSVLRAAKISEFGIAISPMNYVACTGLWQSLKHLRHSLGQYLQ